MASNVLEGLLIRTGVVRRADLGFLLAGDPVKEDAEEPHVTILKWKAGELTRIDSKFNANKTCIFEDPEYGLLRMASSGAYSVETRSGVSPGNIFKNSPPPKAPRYGNIRKVATISGKAYAVGGTGWAFRLDQLASWTLIDEGLPTTFNIEAVGGFSGSDLYAAGYKGEVWHFDGKAWSPCKTPTNVNLNALLCADDGCVYAAGRGGLLMRGRGDTWEVIDQQTNSDDVWDLACFNGVVYASTLAAVYRLRGNDLVPVQFGQVAPKTCYHLSVAPGVMWSIGTDDVMSFDGTVWTRVI